MLAILRQGGFERKTILASFPLAVGGPTVGILRPVVLYSSDAATVENPS